MAVNSTDEDSYDERGRTSGGTRTRDPQRASRRCAVTFGPQTSMKTIIVTALCMILRGLDSYGEWVKLENVSYRNNPANDGDSFHVVHKGKEYLFRLYFVDTPETQSHLTERIELQSGIFGISRKSVLKMGKRAEQFTKDRLSKPFTIWTEWMDAQGDSKMKRFYAFAMDADGLDMGQELVANGLARVYGAQANHPEGPNSTKQWQTLEAKLAEAKAARRGCWNEGIK